MCKVFIKLFSIILLILFIYNNIEKSSGNKTENNYENETFSYQTESSFKSNSSDDYDYNELIEDNDCEEKSSFLEKLKLIHSEGKSFTLRKHVKHINESFELIKNVQTVFNSLFSTDGRTELQLMEFLSEIDLQLSSECSSALFRILSAIRKFDLWAFKCKSKVENS